MSVISRFSLDEYERMLCAGVFAEERRIEFLRGEIVPMSPIGVPHARIVNYLTRWSANVTSSDEVEVSVQNPILVPPSESAPEPDLVWVRPTGSDRHPLPEDIYLVVEVADTTIRLDTIVKAAIYAEGGIQEYWVVDLTGRVVHVHREIIGGKYLTINISRPGDVLNPLAFPQAKLDIERMFAIL